MNLDFELAARGTQYGTGAFLAVVTESGLLVEFLFGDAFFVDISSWRTHAALLHRCFYAGTLLRRHLGESLGRDGRHAGHGMSYGHFPEALLDVEGREFVGGPEGQRGKDNQSKKKFASHWDFPRRCFDLLALNRITHCWLREQIKCGANRLQGKSSAGQIVAGTGATRTSI